MAPRCARLPCKTLNTSGVVDEEEVNVGRVEGGEDLVVKGLGHVRGDALNVQLGRDEEVLQRGPVEGERGVRGGGEGQTRSREASECVTEKKRERERVPPLPLFLPSLPFARPHLARDA